MGLRINKKLVLIGTADGAEMEEFQRYYLDVHAPKVAATEQVSQYYASKIVPPYQELMDAGWGWGGNLFMIFAGMFAGCGGLLDVTLGRPLFK